MLSSQIPSTLFPTTVKTTVKLNGMKKEKASVVMKIKKCNRCAFEGEEEEENGWLRDEHRLSLRIRKVDKQGLRDP